jgi:hypothetical protein
MAGPSTAELAAHLAGIIDGDWDDGLDAHVRASANGNGFHIHLSDGDAERVATYRVIIEQIS